VQVRVNQTRNVIIPRRDVKSDGSKFVDASTNFVATIDDATEV
jgi:hypothetical protein